MLNQYEIENLVELDSEAIKTFFQQAYEMVYGPNEEHTLTCLNLAEEQS